MFLFYLIKFYYLINYIYCDQSRCLSVDVRYTFTDCDKYNGRWRVTVPKKPDHCDFNITNSPVRVESCFTSCDAGTFFNASSLKCELCKPGYYSLGGGTRLNLFDQSSFLDSGFTITKDSSNCSGWKVKNGYLENKLNSSSLTCSSTLTYSVKIVKPGQIKFTYQFIPPEDPSVLILFTFLHFNLEEKALDVDHWREKNSKELTITQGKQRWKKIIFNLPKSGYYTFIWRAIFFGNVQNNRIFFQKRETKSVLEDSFLMNKFGLIKLKNIEIFGVSYASECSPCEPGTYNNQSGLSTCTPCPHDTYSYKQGSTSCLNCEKSQFAFLGSQKCLPKPDCTENDYFQSSSECNSLTRKRSITYKWIEPKICTESQIKLPLSRQESCDPNEKLRQVCSPGMELINGSCEACQDNYWNNGTMKKCLKCPPTTEPIYSLILNNWFYPTTINSLGSLHLSWQCLSKDYHECENDSNSWLFVPSSPSFLRTSSNFPTNSLLILSLSVPGFRRSQGGKLYFKFKLFCEDTDDCELTFIVFKESSDDQFIKIWNGADLDEQVYSHTFQDTSSVYLRWIFTRRSIQSHIKIYKISLTNSIGSGAIECKPCPFTLESDCIPCPKGHYLNITKKKHDKLTGVSQLFFDSTNNNVKLSSTEIDKSKCVKCPADSIINSNLEYPISERSCIKCGPGLKSTEDRSQCYCDCFPKVNSHQVLNLKKLNNFIELKSESLFTLDGDEYYHLFNISICGLFGAVCKNNLSYVFENFDLKEEIHAFICQMTIFPARNISTQPISLGDELLAITHSTSYQNLSVHEEFNKTRSDVHFYFLTKSSTRACKNGHSSIVTLRCDPKLDIDTKVIKPKSCPLGTCDGCNYHFLIKSRTSAACRICTEQDYDKLVGECIDGYQELHYINPKACIFNEDGKNFVKKRPCSMIPKHLKIVITFITCIGLILFALVLHFWKTNRKLEYKYSKLIEDKNSPECCAEEDDDDNETTIRPLRPGRNGKKNRGDVHETIQLTKHIDQENII